MVNDHQTMRDGRYPIITMPSPKGTPQSHPTKHLNKNPIKYICTSIRVYRIFVQFKCTAGQLERVPLALWSVTFSKLLIQINYSVLQQSPISVTELPLSGLSFFQLCLKWSVRSAVNMWRNVDTGCGLMPDELRASCCTSLAAECGRSELRNWTDGSSIVIIMFVTTCKLRKQTTEYTMWPAALTGRA